MLFKRVVSSFIAYYEFAKIPLSSIQRQYKPTGIKLLGGLDNVPKVVEVRSDLD